MIDDTLAIREVLTDVLSTLTETTIYTAANGHAGLEILQQHWPSIVLILLDINMPVLNGEETYKRIQQIAPQVKVIVSSSLDYSEARLRFRGQEMPTFLQKPYDISTLLTLVQLVTVGRVLST